jgi:hypothetical protein
MVQSARCVRPLPALAAKATFEDRLFAILPVIVRVQFAPAGVSMAAPLRVNELA